MKKGQTYVTLIICIFININKYVGIIFVIEVHKYIFDFIYTFVIKF